MTTAPHATPPRTPLRRRLGDAARWLTTPLLPEDYLALVNPLWSTAELRGRIEAVRHEAPGAATLVIRPGRVWPGHRPGQWLKIGVDIDGVRHWRTFSLSSPPRSDGRLTITVKAAADGVVSKHLVHAVRPGTIIRLAEAEGEFTLPSPAPGRILFVTAGSGVTPVMAMLRQLAEHQAGDTAQTPDAASRGRGAGPDIVLIHSARTPDDVIFGAELRALARRLPWLTLHERHTATDGRLKLADLGDACPDWAERETWACGPGDLLDEIARHWADAGAAERLHIERFRPVLAVTDGEGGRVTFAKSGIETDADGATPLLDAGEQAGAMLPSGCRMGICYSCVGRLCSGQVRDLRTGEVHGEEGHLIQTCVSAAAGPVEIDL
ncbi:ferredoxin reductase [Actinomadura barringtoniae]|uniref:Ferredoxin reductase n=1 Tax=Actinomadura barringtoniae TaxID=1427535 RepID=A0A939PFI4_9ACTN|nr:ferredoxin reductase [Actinomadura barringtoniae]MBO2451595.1 ferredoxin reductase [Actinomadura barringtoniae]